MKVSKEELLHIADLSDLIINESEVNNYLENLHAIYFSEIFKKLLDLSIPLIDANVSVRQSVKRKRASIQHQSIGRKESKQQQKHPWRSKSRWS